MRLHVERIGKRVGLTLLRQEKEERVGNRLVEVLEQEGVLIDEYITESVENITTYAANQEELC